MPYYFDLALTVEKVRLYHQNKQRSTHFWIYSIRTPCRWKGRKMRSNFFVPLHPLPYALKPHKSEKMTPASQPLSVSQSFSFSDLYDTSTSLLDDSSPSTPLGGSLLPPVNVPHLSNNHTNAYTTNQGYEKNAFTQLIHRCCQLDDEL